MLKEGEVAFEVGIGSGTVRGTWLLLFVPHPVWALLAVSWIPVVVLYLERQNVATWAKDRDCHSCGA